MSSVLKRLAGAAAVLVVHILLLSSVQLSFAQPVSCASRTGANATVFFEAGDVPLDEGILRAYSEENRCVGQVHWYAGEMPALTIWGDDPFTPEIDGLSEGESFTLHLEATDAPPSSTLLDFRLDVSEFYYARQAAFEENAIFIVESFSGMSPAPSDCISGAPTSSVTNRREDANYVAGGSETGIQERNKSKSALDSRSLQIFPNPASNWTRLEYSAPPGSLISLELYDLLGRRISMIYEAEQSNDREKTIRWDTTNLANGAYIVRLETPCGVQDGVVHIIN